MSVLTPRDLKDITDLVSRKLEMYLNIDERERRFNPEGCYTVSPRMHKYDVMYRLLESKEIEKTKKDINRTPRSRSNNSQNDKSRSRSRGAKTPRGQGGATPARCKTPKSGREISTKTTDIKKPKTQPEVKPERISNRYKYRPIAIKTPRTNTSMVGYKESKRLESYANQVYESHPVKDLQAIHHVCPRIPNNGKVQNYTPHVGAALNTKNYVDFYLKAGLDGKASSPRRKTVSKEITHKGIGRSSSRCKRYPDYSLDCQEDDTARAVVTFKSPDETEESELNYQIINSRDEYKDAELSKNSSDLQLSFQKNQLVSLNYQESVEPENINNGQIVQYLQDQSLKTDPDPIPRCKSRFSRKTSSLNINYNSASDDDLTSSKKTNSNSDAVFIKSKTSTRTNSPSTSRESIDTPSSYQEYDSCESSDSSVLRHYRLSTGEIYSPRQKKLANQVKTSQNKSSRKSKSPSQIITPRREKLNVRATHIPNDDDYSTSSSCDTPRYNLLARPSSRILNRSSVRSNSVTDEGNATPRSSTPRAPQRSHRPKSSVRKSREKKLIDLNLTAIVRREQYETSTTGTGDDDVFAEGAGNKSTDEQVFERASDNATSDSRQSRGQFDDSDHDSITREEYFTLQKNRGSACGRSQQAQISSNVSTPRATKHTDCCNEDISQNVSTYSTMDTLVINNDENCEVTQDCNAEPECVFLARNVLNSELNTQLPANAVEFLNGNRELGFKQHIGSAHDGSETEMLTSTEKSSSDGEFLSRGNDEQGKDGRGSGRRSATSRTPSRGCQWEDERPKSDKTRYQVGRLDDPDERGGYQVLPEYRGISTEKGWDEGAPEYYVITQPESEDISEVNKSQNKSACLFGIPPKSRPKSEQQTKNNPQNSGRGETSQVNSPVNYKSSEVYKALCQLAEIEMDLNGVNTNASSITENVACDSENIIHFNLLPDVSSEGPGEARGEFSSTLHPQHKDIITQPYQAPKPQTNLVFDLQEKTDEFRGKVDTTEAIPLKDHNDDKENVLGRGIFKSSSMASSLSWSDKYISESAADESTTANQETIAIANNPTIVHKNSLDEDILNNLMNMYERKDEHGSPVASEDGAIEKKVEGILSQLEILVKAKNKYTNCAQNDMDDEPSFVRGEEKNDGSDSVTEITNANVFEATIPKQEILNAAEPEVALSISPDSPDVDAETPLTTENPQSNQEYSKSNKIKIHQSSFFETPLGISGDVVDCVESDKDSVVRQRHSTARGKLSSQDITVLKTPCVVVATEDSGQIVDVHCSDLKPPQKGLSKYKVEKRALERGDIKKSRRPRSATNKSSLKKSTKQRPSSSVYFST